VADIAFVRLVEPSVKLMEENDGHEKMSIKMQAGDSSYGLRGEKG
jgi:hypothetical protein